MRVLKEPLLHFLLLGILIYLLYAFFGRDKSSEESEIVVISQGEIEWLETNWQQLWNRPPTPDERQALIDEHAREKVLYQVALDMGLDKEDVIIRRRMVQKIEFLGADLLQPDEPTDEEVRKYYEENKATYQLPDLISLSHIYFDPDKRADRTLKDAEKVLSLLYSKAISNIEISDYGDRFMLQQNYSKRTQQEIQKLFGSGFSDTVFRLETGKWHGPVLSGYGTHLVYIDEHVRSQPVGWEPVKDRVKADWMKSKQQELNDNYIEGLLSRYTIVIEDEKDTDRKG